MICPKSKQREQYASGIALLRKKFTKQELEKLMVHHPFRNTFIPRSFLASLSFGALPQEIDPRHLEHDQAVQLAFP